MNRQTRFRRLTPALVIGALTCGLCMATLGADFSVTRAQFAGGGGYGSGGPFSVQGSVGQSDAHAARTSDEIVVGGGFWAVLNLLFVNRPPTANGDLVVRLNNSLFAKVPITSLLNNDRDPDGDPLSLVQVNSALPTGSTVVVRGPWVVYTAVDVNAGGGGFSYTISDGPGGHTATGHVAVSAVEPPEPGGDPNTVAIEGLAGNIRMTFLGVPGYRYRVLYTTDVSPPYSWREFSPAALYTAPDSGFVGIFHHTDSHPPERMRLYRAVPAP